MPIAINRSFTASFDVDPQNTFTPVCPNELPVPEGDQIASHLNEMAKHASIRVGSKDAHTSTAKWIADENHPQFSPVEDAGDNVDIHWNSHAIIGTKGFELLESLPSPERYDFFIWKGIEDNLHPYGACYHDLKNKLSTGVIEFLKLNRISTVLVGGLALDYCVKNTALQLRSAGFEVIINLAATRGIDESTISESKALMEEVGIQFVSSNEDLFQQTEVAL